uniref:Catalase n=1 Tax=Heterorhabditis bacteriophora TaxID=37862 RepID=A0A1I7WAM7_HETBA
MSNTREEELDPEQGTSTALSGVSPRRSRGTTGSAVANGLGTQHVIQDGEAFQAYVVPMGKSPGPYIPGSP